MFIRLVADKRSVLAAELCENIGVDGTRRLASPPGAGAQMPTK
jgi:hypothetical protein